MTTVETCAVVMFPPPCMQEIHNMLKENNKVLKCSNASPDWRGYVDFVNNVVVDGLSRVICASLDYLLDQVRWRVSTRNGKHYSTHRHFTDTRFTPQTLMPSKKDRTGRAQPSKPLDTLYVLRCIFLASRQFYIVRACF